MDVTSEMDAAGILSDAELRLRETANAVPTMIWMLGPGMPSTFFYNKGWLDFVGRGQSQGEDHSRGIHPDDREQCMQSFAVAMEARSKISMEYRRRAADGEYRWLLDSGVPRFAPDGEFLGFIGCAADITERRNLERERSRQRNELAHLARVAVLGELTGALAHELNQPLTAILSNAQAAQGFLADGRSGIDEMRAILEDIVSEDRRAGEVIRRLRMLFRKGEVQCEAISLNEMAADALKLMNNELVNHHVKVRTEFTPPLPPVDGDRVQIQQVLINLILNATDAMADTPIDKRTLTVSSRLSDEGDVEVCVSDTGCGIPGDQLERLFEPFFTTKSQGMGLGLTVCRTIIAAHSGKLSACNNVGGGACFNVTIPPRRTGAGV